MGREGEKKISASLTCFLIGRKYVGRRLPFGVGAYLHLCVFEQEDLHTEHEEHIE